MPSLDHFDFSVNTYVTGSDSPFRQGPGNCPLELLRGMLDPKGYTDSNGTSKPFNEVAAGAALNELIRRLNGDQKSPSHKLTQSEAAAVLFEISLLAEVQSLSRELRNRCLETVVQSSFSENLELKYAAGPLVKYLFQNHFLKHDVAILIANTLYYTDYTIGDRFRKSKPDTPNFENFLTFMSDVLINKSKYVSYNDALNGIVMQMQIYLPHHDVFECLLGYIDNLERDINNFKQTREIVDHLNRPRQPLENFHYYMAVTSPDFCTRTWGKHFNQHTSFSGMNTHFFKPLSSNHNGTPTPQNEVVTTQPNVIHHDPVSLLPYNSAPLDNTINSTPPINQSTINNTSLIKTTPFIPTENTFAPVTQIPPQPAPPLPSLDALKAKILTRQEYAGQYSDGKRVYTAQKDIVFKTRNPELANVPLRYSIVPEVITFIDERPLSNGKKKQRVKYLEVSFKNGPKFWITSGTLSQNTNRLDQLKKTTIGAVISNNTGNNIYKAFTKKSLTQDSDNEHDAYLITSLKDFYDHYKNTHPNKLNVPLKEFTDSYNTWLENNHKNLF